MIIRSRVASLFLLILSSFLPFILAETPTSFCKCTCFSNSTIIPLGPPKPRSSSNPSPERRAVFLPSLFGAREAVNDDVYGRAAFLGRRDAADAQLAKSEDDKSKSGGDKEGKKFRAVNCNDCNRKFCLDYQLPMCKGAKEEDVMTTCFQRESNKDKAVVFIFIIATVSLLVWAAVKPWAERWIQVRDVPQADTGVMSRGRRNIV
ncbi:conserved hypothetical protein [Uncinocarpus reesii 1704]|uniref:Uncharacterized protein n=1 Tax=Uncinocarpus reesii (strain UAMH 1704) TaxID=336963 RepID=C4JJ47_UNCRE|nr:uncharacterized protein UREG_01654 [Uncinocarpus reesii 1704]EEP76805.1 conserved hypothetical protein [Uncinocarpus reesii 1704]